MRGGGGDDKGQASGDNSLPRHDASERGMVVERSGDMIHGSGDVPHQLYWHEGGYIKILYERVTCFEI